MSKMVFDTLHYAKMLKNGGIVHAEVHSASLAKAIAENIYIRDEVDTMFNKALQRFDARTYQMRNEMRSEFRESIKEFAAQTQKIREETKESVKKLEETNVLIAKDLLLVENRFERALNRHLYATIGIWGSLIVVVGVIATFAHAFL